MSWPYPHSLPGLNGPVLLLCRLYYTLDGLGNLTLHRLQDAADAPP
jgi:hypothetical protein